MNSNDTVNSLVSKPKPFYGYFLVIVLGFAYFCSSGIMLTTASVVNPLMLQDSALHMDGTMLGTGFSLFVLMQGVSAPVVGVLISKKGSRFSMLLGAVLQLCAVLLLIYVVSSPILYFIAFGLIASSASMMVGQLAVQSTVGNWFVLHRGIAMTAMMVIGASSSFIAPPIVNAIVTATGVGWRAGWYLVAILSVILIPVIFFFVKNRPADIDQYPDGLEESPTIANTKKYAVFKCTEDIPFNRVIRKPAFWLIALTAASGFAAYTLSTAQGVLHFTSQGIAYDDVVIGVSIMGGVSLVGKVFFGVISDRVEPVRLMVISACVLFVGVLTGAVAYNSVMAFIFYGCVGLGFGGINAVFPTSMANYFGIFSMSKNLGTGILITTLIASWLPIMAGFIYDSTGNCTLAFFITAGIIAVCAVCGIFVKIPKQR